MNKIARISPYPQRIRTNRDQVSGRRMGLPYLLKGGKLWFVGLLVCSLMACEGLAQSPGELVLNGGFEIGNLTNWTASGDTAGLQVSIGFSHSGFYGLLFGSLSSFAYVSQTLPTTGGQKYLLSFWVLNDGQKKNGFSVDWGGSTLLNVTDLIVPQWTNMQFIVTAPDTNTVLRIGGWNNTDYTVLDDVSVTPPPPDVGTNSTPILPVIPAQAIDVLKLLTVTNTANEANSNAVVTYTLLNPKAGMNIDSNGIFTWLPTPDQSPSTNTVTTVATSTLLWDETNPRLKSTNSFAVVVREVNTAPVLPEIGAQTNDELTQMVVTNTVTLQNAHATITYALQTPPAGASIASDGIIKWTPSEAQGPGNYTITTVATSYDPLDLVNPYLYYTNSFDVTVNEVNARPVLPVQVNRSVNELALFIVTNTASDADIPANLLTYQLINPPSGAMINDSGVITWTPTETQGPGAFTFTTVVTDDGVPPLSATNSFTVTVNEVNTAPVLPAQDPQTVDELDLLLVVNTASDADIPANTLSYQLVNPPAGAAIDSFGVISWTPTEAQGPGVYTLTTIVTDNGVPALKATNSFTVTVNDVNSAPVLPVQTNRVVNELVQLVVTNKATDTDIPANVLTYLLINPPPGATIDSSGVIRWTPSESAGPGTYTLSTAVTDNGTPSLGATNSFIVTVNEVNTAPVLPAQANRTVNELTQLTVTNTATDADIPANLLIYELVNPPDGALIDLNGVIRWTPVEEQGPGTYTVTTVVTDTGIPALKATNTFTVTVNEVNSAPALPAQINRTINELSLLTVTNTATDPDFPANALSYQLINGPAGSAIDNKGVITWIPSESQGPGTYTITTVVTDNGVPPLSDTNSFTVTVNDVNTAPTLAPIGDQTVRKQTLLTFTATATDPDLPVQTLTFSLVPGAPAGAAIDSATGVFTWTPASNQAPSTNAVTVRVTDNGAPPLNDTKSFVIVVTDSNAPPVLGDIAAQTVNEGSTLTFTAVATDSDTPAQTLTYSLDAGAPAGATINPSTGAFSWTPTEAQGPTTNYVIVRVTDNGSPPASGSQTVAIVVKEVNQAPVLPVQGSRSLNELTQLVVTNTATDADIPANILSYQLVAPPAGATIDSNGVIHWTPAQGQGGTSYTLKTVVTDNGTPPLSATNSFSVTVNVINVSQPVLRAPVITGSTVTLSWTSVSGKTYRVQYKTDLSAITWNDLAGDVTASGNTASKTDTFTGSIRFYRVELLP